MAGLIASFPAGLKATASIAQVPLMPATEAHAQEVVLGTLAWTVA